MSTSSGAFRSNCTAVLESTRAVQAPTVNWARPAGVRNAPHAGPVCLSLCCFAGPKFTCAVQAPTKTREFVLALGAQVQRTRLRTGEDA